MRRGLYFHAVYSFYSVLCMRMDCTMTFVLNENEVRQALWASV